MRRLAGIFAVSVAAFAGVSPALAHPGHGDAAGFLHGIAHPLGGLDHLLAMVAVGVFAALLGGRAVWLVPLTFVTVMAGAGVVGAAGYAMPYTEVGIALSVVLLGAAIALRVRPPVAVAAGMVGLFAIFHGYAHGAEMPETASGLAYGVGFVVATALLHGAGLVIGRVLASRPAAATLSRLGGGAVTLAGLALLAGAV